jgi:hypothetical protein
VQTREVFHYQLGFIEPFQFRTSLRILAIRSGATFGAWHRWERPSDNEPFPFLHYQLGFIEPFQFERLGDAAD